MRGQKARLVEQDSLPQERGSQAQATLIGVVERRDVGVEGNSGTSDEHLFWCRIRMRLRGGACRRKEAPQVRLGEAPFATPADTARLEQAAVAPSSN